MNNDDFYPPGLANHPDAPYNQEAEEHDPREDLFQEMVDFLEENDSDFMNVHLDSNGWFYKKPKDHRRYPLPNKYWLVAKE